LLDTELVSDMIDARDHISKFLLEVVQSILENARVRI
jgi:hypothetical protein